MSKHSFYQVIHPPSLLKQLCGVTACCAHVVFLLCCLWRKSVGMLCLWKAPPGPLISARASWVSPSANRKHPCTLASASLALQWTGIRHAECPWVGIAQHLNNLKLQWKRVPHQICRVLILYLTIVLQPKDCVDLCSSVDFLFVVNCAYVSIEQMQPCHSNCVPRCVFHDLLIQLVQHSKETTHNTFAVGEECVRQQRDNLSE